MINQPEKKERARKRGPRLKVIDGEGQFGRTPPHSLEAEEHLLSACFLDGAGTLRLCLAAGLQPRHFFAPGNQLVFEAMLHLHEQQRPIDVAVVAEQLKAEDKLAATGGYGYLAQVSSRIPTSAQAAYFLDRVLNLAILRRIIHDAGEVVETSFGHDGEDLLPWTGVVAAKFQAIADYVLHRTRKVTQKGAARAAAEDAEKVALGKVDKSRWLHFPAPKMDQAFLPIDPRQEDWLILVAAPPSGGKSSYLRWLTGHFLLNNKRGIVFLLETSRKRFMQMLAASFAGLNLRHLEDIAKLRPGVYADFQAWMTEIESWMEERLWVYDDVISLEDISRVTRDVHRIIRERELAAGIAESEVRGLDFAIGDYIQIVTTRTQFFKRTEELAHITRALKQLHRGLDVPGFWGAQITREARNLGRRPVLADLGESKALEEAADRVQFLHVPSSEEEEGGGMPSSRSVLDLEVIQRKSRNGPRDIAIDLSFEVTVGRFTDPSGKTFASTTPAPKGPVKKGDFR